MAETRRSESLTITVPCSTSPRSTPISHPITLRSDWSVVTPHDLDAERLAVALGGGSHICVDLVDRVVPALRKKVGLDARSIRPRISGGRNSWKVKRVTEYCTCTEHFDTAQEAARHARSTGHLSEEFGCSETTLEWLASATEAWATALSRRANFAEPVRIREANGVRQLWEAGIHPRELRALALRVAVVQQPLPVAYYLAAAYGPVNPEFVARAINSRPDAETAAWLVETHFAFPNPHGDLGPYETDVLRRLSAWLKTEAELSDITTLVRSGVDPTIAHELAAHGGSLREATRELAAWTTIGCRPTTRDLLILERHGRRAHVPNRNYMLHLRVRLRMVVPKDVEATTELGLLLALTGDLEKAAAAWELGFSEARRKRASTDSAGNIPGGVGT